MQPNLWRPIRGVIIKNVNVRDAGKTASLIQGSERASGILYIDGVSLINIRMPNQSKYASTLEEMAIEKNSFTRNIKVIVQK